MVFLEDSYDVFYFIFNCRNSLKNLTEQDKWGDKDVIIGFSETMLVFYKKMYFNKAVTISYAKCFSTDSMSES